LLLPLFDKQSGADSTVFGYWSLDPIPELTVSRSIIARSDTSRGLPEKIYKTLATNDKEKFFYLTGVFGIDKILWRDDLLFADKKTTSKDFVDIKKRLESYEGISLEKKVGLWSLYSISSPYSTSPFYTPSSIIRSNLTLDEALNKDVASGKSVILPLQTNSQPPYRTMEQVTSVSCISCKNDSRQKKDGILSNFVEKAVIYPDSILYPIISINEQLQLKKARANPAEEGYLFLAYSNKRLAEINGMSQRQQNSHSQEFINQNISLYKSEINNSLSMADKIDSSDRNDYYVNLLEYLDQEKQYVI